MSLILEALKRAEAQRGPGDPVVICGTGGAVARRTNHRWLWAAAAGAVAAGAMLLMVLFWPGKEVPLKHGGPRSLPSPVALATPSVPPLPLEAPSLAVSPPRKAVSAAMRKAAPPPPVAKAPAQPAVLPERRAVVPEKAQTAPPASPVAASPPPPPPSAAQPAVEPAPAASVRDEAAAKDALRALREILDKVSVSAHVYAEEPSQRFVFVNGRVYREGERVNPEGFRIESITADGLLVEKEGARLKVPAGR